MDMRKWMLAVAVIIIAGCATIGGYQPTVDPYNDPDAARIPSDEAECRDLALHASGGTAKQTAIGGGVGGGGRGAGRGGGGGPARAPGGGGGPRGPPRGARRGGPRGGAGPGEITPRLP